MLLCLILFSLLCQEAAAEAAGTNDFVPNELEQIDEVAFLREPKLLLYLSKKFIL